MGREKIDLLLYKSRKRNNSDAFPKKWDFVCEYVREGWLDNPIPTIVTSPLMKGLAQKVSKLAYLGEELFSFGQLHVTLATDYSPKHNQIYANGSFDIQETGVSKKELVDFHDQLTYYLLEDSEPGMKIS